jgi:hypothetical protein
MDTQGWLDRRRSTAVFAFSSSERDRTRAMLAAPKPLDAHVLWLSPTPFRDTYDERARKLHIR